MGASRGQLLRQLLAEVLVLFAAAGAIAIPIAALLGAGLRTLLPVLPVPINFDLEITTRTILFTADLLWSARLHSGSRRRVMPSG